jgi:hypothetical protein
MSRSTAAPTAANGTNAIATTILGRNFINPRQPHRVSSSY